MADSMNSDHDLLISMKAEFSTKLDRVISDVKELRDNFSTRVSNLEEEKSDKSFVTTLEVRTAELESFMNNMKGKYAILAILGMAIISLATAYITKHF